MLNKSGYEVGIQKTSYDNFTIIPMLDLRNLTRKVPIVLMILHSYINKDRLKFVKSFANFITFHFVFFCPTLSFSLLSNLKGHIRHLKIFLKRPKEIFMIFQHNIFRDCSSLGNNRYSAQIRKMIYELLTLIILVRVPYHNDNQDFLTKLVCS